MITQHSRILRRTCYQGTPRLRLAVSIKKPGTKTGESLLFVFFVLVRFWSLSAEMDSAFWQDGSMYLQVRLAHPKITVLVLALATVPFRPCRKSWPRRRRQRSTQGRSGVSI